MNKIMLSIFVPSYNHSKYIIECLKALKSIPISKEIILIDDCSKDESVKLINEFILYEDLEKEIKFTKNSVNKGVKNSLNFFLSTAKGKYVFLMASDDVVLPEGIINVFNFMESDDKLMFVIANALNKFEDNTLKNVYNYKHNDFFKLSEEKRYEEIFTNYPQPILSQSTLIRMEALKTIRVWDAGLMLDDFEMFIKLFLRYPKYNQDFIFLQNVNIVLYRHHSNNSYRNIYRQFFMVKQVIDSLAPEELKTKAIIYNFNRYFLMSIKYRDFSFLVKSVRIVPLKIFLVSFLYLPKMIIKKVFS
ncbi:MAG: glycosyltransferase family 2 protein [Arcobacter sp.]|uniref:glycosyltransferase family 2 protein n=1 Tax=Arcobacter sp. TaxID=1872629 RepID=UPI003CFF54D0